MNAAKPARKMRQVVVPPKPAVSSTEAAARLVALLDSPGYLDVQRAQAALWLLSMVDGGHLMFYDHGAMSAEDLEDWCRGIVKDAIAASLAAAEQKIADAVKAGKAEVA